MFFEPWFFPSFFIIRFFFQWAICHGISSVGETYWTRVCCQIHQKEKAGNFSKGRGQGRHPKRNSHFGRNGTHQHHLSASSLRKWAKCHTCPWTVSALYIFPPLSSPSLASRPSSFKLCQSQNTLCTVFGGTWFLTVWRKINSSLFMHRIYCPYFSIVKWMGQFMFSGRICSFASCA